MRAGSNSKVDSKAPSKSRPRSKLSSKKWFGMLANRLHRLRNFLLTRRGTVKAQQVRKYILGGVIAVGFTFFCASDDDSLRHWQSPHHERNGQACSGCRLLRASNRACG